MKTINLIVNDPQGVQRLLSVHPSGGVSIDSDTGQPVMEVLWDERNDGPLSPEQLAQVGGFTREGNNLVFSQASFDANEKNKPSEPEFPLIYKGEHTFNAYAFLFAAATHFAKRATADEYAGRLQCESLGLDYFPMLDIPYARSVAVMCAAFTIEAHLNHVGQGLFAFWDIVEKKLSWQEKFALICPGLGLNFDKGTRPYQTIRSMFTLRDFLAHGKTTTYEVSHEWRSPTESPPMILGPPQITKYWTAEMVEFVIEDTEQVIAQLHDAAGLHHLHTMGVGGGHYTPKRASTTETVGPDNLN